VLGVLLVRTVPPLPWIYGKMMARLDVSVAALNFQESHYQEKNGRMRPTRGTPSPLPTV
jgi:hypothetical protein